MASALIAEDEPLLRTELRELLSAAWPELLICAEASNGIEAMAALDEHVPDILFLDIKMPGHSGIDIARRASGRAHIVFVTAYDHYAISAFEEGAVDYLLKPINQSRLAKTVERLRKSISAPPTDLGTLVEKLRGVLIDRPSHLEWISVQHGEELRLITVDEICYFRSDEKYTTAVTRNAEHLLSRPLVALEAELDPKRFWRVHRGIIVNIASVRSLHRDFRGRLEILLKDRQETLPVSAPHAHRFKQM